MKVTDPVAVNKARVAYGGAFAAALRAGPVLAVIADESIQPAEMVTGLMIAHAEGVASAVAAASEDPRARRLILEAMMRHAEQTLDEMEGARHV